MNNQLLRSGTSIGANVEEAIVAQSKKDFISKMSISLKEARETNYWLRLLRDSKISTSETVSPLITESEELIKILYKIIDSSSKKIDN
jgi:four helix bundle protein